MTPRPEKNAIRPGLVTALCVTGLTALLTFIAPGRGADRDDDAKAPKPAVSKETAVTDTGASKDSETKEKDDEVKLSPEAIKRYGIGTGTAKKTKLVSHVTAPARLSFNGLATAVVGSSVQGRVIDLKVAVGDVVKKGDELLVVESPELGEAQSDYLQKRTAVLAAAPAIDAAKSAYERAKSLYESSQGIALTELQKREVEYKTAQSTGLTAEAVSKTAGSKLRLLGMDPHSVEQLVKSGEINPRYTLRSPMDGTVTERFVTPGELVKPEREKLIVVVDMTTLWVLADVPEARLKEVKVGCKASVTVPAAGDQSFDGNVSKIALSVDPATRTVRVQIDLKSDPALKPGMFAVADISNRLSGDNGEETVLAVPASAVQIIDGSTTVFVPVKGEEGTFGKRLVSTGNTAGGMVSIISGLDDGERVVTAGTSILKAEVGKSSSKDND